jgi:hypothetical protein
VALRAAAADIEDIGQDVPPTARIRREPRTLMMRVLSVEFDAMRREKVVFLFSVLPIAAV